MAFIHCAHDRRHDALRVGVVTGNLDRALSAFLWIRVCVLAIDKMGSSSLDGKSGVPTRRPRARATPTAAFRLVATPFCGGEAWAHSPSINGASSLRSSASSGWRFSYGSTDLVSK